MSDTELFQRAQELGAIIITHDEDFADERQFPVGTHMGVVRLHVDPTTDEVTTTALERLFDQLALDELSRNLIIVERGRIRIIKRSAE